MNFFIFKFFFKKNNGFLSLEMSYLFQLYCKSLFLLVVQVLDVCESPQSSFGCHMSINEACHQILSPLSNETKNSFEKSKSKYPTQTGSQNET